MTMDGKVTERTYLYTGPVTGQALANCGLQSILEPDGYWLMESATDDLGPAVLVCSGHASLLIRTRAKKSIPAWTLGTLQFWLVRYGRCEVNLRYDLVNGDRNTVSLDVEIPVVNVHHIKHADKRLTYRQSASQLELLVDDLGDLIVEKWSRLKNLMEAVETQDELVGTPSGKFK